MYSANKLSAELRHSNKKITDYSLKMIYIKYDKKLMKGKAFRKIACMAQTMKLQTF